MYTSFFQYDPYNIMFFACMHACVSIYTDSAESKEDETKNNNFEKGKYLMKSSYRMYVVML